MQKHKMVLLVEISGLLENEAYQALFLHAFERNAERLAVLMGRCALWAQTL